MSNLGFFPIHNMPSADLIWKTLGSNLNNISQAICELVDNSISNFRKYSDHLSLVRTVRIMVTYLGEIVEIIVEDGGTGIENLDNAMTLAGMADQETPLNEHGYGLKHTCAYMDNNSGDWFITTRTQEDAYANRYRHISPPYDFGSGVIHGAFYPGWIGTLNDTGTMIHLSCPMNVFQTLSLNSKKQLSFDDLVDILTENLRYTYAKVLEEENIQIEVISDNGRHIKTQVLQPLFPTWADGTLVELPVQTYDLGGGPISIQCKYGSILPSKDSLNHYAGNMASSGVEISLNNRVIEHGLVKPIWGRSLHPSQNAFLAQINLVSDSAAALPATKTAKNGFRLEHPYLQKLFQWIRAGVEIPSDCYQTQEERLFRLLQEKKEAVPGMLRVAREEKTFQSLGLNELIDLFTYHDNKVTIYEGKAGNTTPRDVYQLMMYWHGCIQDGVPADEGILIGKHHPKSVLSMIEYVNDLAGPDDRPYHFRTVTWAEEGIAS